MRARSRCGAGISSSTSRPCASSDSASNSFACGSSTCAVAKAAFAERALGDVQLLLTKPGCRRDAHRDLLNSHGAGEYGRRGVEACANRCVPRSGPACCSRTPRTPPRCSPTTEVCSKAARWRSPCRATSRKSHGCWPGATRSASAWCPRAAIPATAAAPRPTNRDCSCCIGLRRLNRIRQVDAANYSMTVEAGCTLGEVQRAAADAQAILSAASWVRRTAARSAATSPPTPAG